MALTATQQRILDFISEYQASVGFSPTVREIGKAVGLSSTSSVAHQLRILEYKGCIRRPHDAPRAIQVTGATPQPSRPEHKSLQMKAVVGVRHYGPDDPRTVAARARYYTARLTDEIKRVRDNLTSDQRRDLAGLLLEEMHSDEY